MVFTVAGGDMRFAILCDMLAEGRHEIRAFALERAKLPAAVRKISSPKDAAGTDCLILPLPVSMGAGVLNSPMSGDGHLITELLFAVSPGTAVCGGMMDADTVRACAELGLLPSDYFRREEFTAANAAATAEGAISVIMSETAHTLWRSRILVIGYGRIGRLLAHRLEGFCADVAVSARSCGDMAWINAWGWEALDSRALEGRLGDFDVIVNTVPAPVLGARQLSEIKPGALCLDLASKPGGVDLEAAAALGVRVVWALGLPGEAAPQTAGAAIRDAVYNILKEQGRIT